MVHAGVADLNASKFAAVAQRHFRFGSLVTGTSRPFRSLHHNCKFRKLVMVFICSKTIGKGIPVQSHSHVINMSGYFVM